MHGATISMQCLVCAGEARDRTPQNFDGYVIECPSCGNYEVAGGAGDRLQNASMQGPRRSAGKSSDAQRRREMANDQKHLLLIPKNAPSVRRQGAQAGRSAA